MLVSKMSSNCCVQQEPEILETVDRVDEAVDEAVDKAVVESSVKRRKTAEVKPEDAVAKFAFHPTGPKFVNAWLWSHFKLSRRHEQWALCAICEKTQRIMWVPRVDGSTSKMKKHLVEEHKM